MKHLTSSGLLARLKTLVADERRATLALIECLEEAQERRLYAELGYGSLWEFATIELGLSEGAAQRRIQAMRLTRDVPESKAALVTGTLSLSNAAKVQSFRQAEKKLGRTPDASALVAQVQGLSQRDCEKKLIEISPDALPKESERVVGSDGERELKIVISPELHEKLQRLKGMLAHAVPEATHAQLLELMTEEMLVRLEKKKGIGLEEDAAATAAAAVERANPKPAGERVYIAVAVDRALGARSGGRCEIVTQGRRCPLGTGSSGITSCRWRGEGATSSPISGTFVKATICGWRGRCRPKGALIMGLKTAKSAASLMFLGISRTLTI